MTKIQEIILNLLSQPKVHYTAEEIFWLVKQRQPSIAMGTVYRNLNTFADSNKIRRVKRADGPDLFEGNTEPHDHAVCIRCGKISDLRLDEIKQFLYGNRNFEVVSFSLIVNCICSDCIMKEEQ